MNYHSNTLDWSLGMKNDDQMKMALNSRPGSFDKINITGEDRENWSELKGPRGHKIKQDVSQWKSNDFREYVKERFYKKFGVAPSAIGAASANCSIKKISEMLAKQTNSEPSNEVIKEYIDFCFDKFVEDILAKEESKFNISKLARIKFVLDFSKRSEKPKKKDDIEILFTQIEKPEDIKEKIEESYSVGINRLILTFGLILPINFLILKKNYNKDDAYSIVKTSSEKLVKNKNSAKQISEATQSNGPYPSWLPFLDYKKIIKDITGVDAKKGIEVGDNEKMGFLK